MQLMTNQETGLKRGFRTLYLSFWSSEAANLAQVCVRASKRSLLVELMDGENLSVIIHVKSKKRYRSVRELFRLVAEGGAGDGGVRGRVGPGAVYFVAESNGDSTETKLLEVVVASGSGRAELVFFGDEAVPRAKRVAARVLEILDGWFKGREALYKEGQ